MKRVFFVLFATLFAALVPTSVATAETGTFSNSGSCAGTTPWGVFQAITYQYVSVINDEFYDERHRFSFGGFLDGAEDAEYVYGLDNKWRVYRAGDFDIAVPYIEDAGLFVKDNRKRSDEWVELCSY